MLVRDILKLKNGETKTIGPEQKVKEAMSLLLENKISCLPVVSPEGELMGIVSDKDIFRKAYQSPEQFLECAIKEIMTARLIVGLESDEIGYIGGIMTKNRIRHVPIVEQDRLIGLVSVGDVVKSQIENMEIENRYLKQYIDGSYPG